MPTLDLLISCDAILDYQEWLSTKIEYSSSILVGYRELGSQGLYGCSDYRILNTGIGSAQIGT